MNHTKIIKYIKSDFKNILDENIKFHEQIIENNYIKHYIIYCYIIIPILIV